MATLIPLQKRKVTLDVLHAKIAQAKPDELPELVASMQAHITDLHQRISDARYSLMANPSMSSEALFNCCANAHEALEYPADELKQTRAGRTNENAKTGNVGDKCCPECKTETLIMFDADNNQCTRCKKVISVC